MVRAARAAVCALFFVNGALISSVIPRLPEIKSDLGLSNSALGLAVAAASFGALLAGPFSGTVSARFGSRRVVLLSGVVYGGVLPLIGLAGSWGVLAACLFAVGVLDVLMDVAMNDQGLAVQVAYKRSIINVFHAWWSVGATVGGAIGAAAAALSLSLPWQLVGVGAVLALVTVACRRPLAGVPVSHADDAAGGAGLDPPVAALVKALVAFAVLSVAGAIVEDVPGSFGAVYLRDGLSASPGVAGLAYVGFVAGLTVGRFGADRYVDRHGAGRVVRAGNTLAALGLGVALLVGHPAAAVAGFTAVGLGASATIPSLFVAAGRATARPAHGIALVSWAARIGFLASPVVVGVVADAAGLPVGVSLCVAAAAVLALAGERVIGDGGGQPASRERSGST